MAVAVAMVMAVAMVTLVVQEHISGKSTKPSHPRVDPSDEATHPTPSDPMQPPRGHCCACAPWCE